MIPTVKQRQNGAVDFKSFYENICALQNVPPLQSIACHVGEGILDINADRLRITDWDPILKALKINKNLRFVAFRSFALLSKNKDQNQNCHRRLMPALLSNRNLLRSLFRTLRCTLRITSSLSFLELQNLPLSSVDMACLCAGISKNRTIRHLSFEGSPIGDSGLLDLCQAIRHAPEIATLNLTGCKISPRGVDGLAALIRVSVY
ncbi:Centrosomal protein of 78 kDa [Paragonimus heterotremus]|uniref:Centrosomal protein of 78 kDa n=1 Tax=Paragonimus heterotremus TaxID=100268 RepID=A0A8J4SNS4_9TREM|nr:Centrosomal protein of 78 kDa [Paragonimus heterotremus]